MSRLVVRGIGRLWRSGGLAPIDQAALVAEDGVIAWVGGEGELARSSRGEDEEIDLDGSLVTPGFVDAHTHPVYAGRRFAEIARRSEGASYLEIAQSGGGIAASVAATRAVGSEELEAVVRARLARWFAGGTTTVEAKTGYHLEPDGELASIRMLARLAREADSRAAASLPAVEVTWLGGHAVAPEWQGDPDGYAAEVASTAPEARAAGARHADVFCDEGYFTVEQSRVMLTAAKAASLLPRIHADELARTGGGELAAELGCSSADHLLCLDERGAGLLVAAGVVATLAPITALAMGRRPPARALVDAGATIALGTDHNPGTCGTTSMSLVVALGVAELGLSVRESLEAATSGGAASLRLGDRGSLAPGMRADFVAWDADHEGVFAWSYGMTPLAVFRSGRPRSL